MWAVVPLKSPDAAKSRLRTVLDDGARRGLFFALAQHVVRTLRASPDIDGVLVVTSSAEVARRVDALGARVLLEDGDDGTAGACTRAVAHLQGMARRVLMVSGDLPLLSAAALAPILALDQAERMVAVVPDRHRRGTNALLCSPADIIPACFGEDSFQRHVLHALERGAQLHILESDAIGLDIDVPDDLDVLRARVRAGVSDAGSRSVVSCCAELQP